MRRKWRTGRLPAQPDAVFATHGVDMLAKLTRSNQFAIDPSIPRTFRAGESTGEDAALLGGPNGYGCSAVRVGKHEELAVPADKGNHFAETVPGAGLCVRGGWGRSHGCLQARVSLRRDFILHGHFSEGNGKILRLKVVGELRSQSLTASCTS